MDEDAFNIAIRKFLKNVGITSQREIDGAVRAALSDGRLADDGTVKAKVTLSIEQLGLTKVIEGDIDLT